MYKLSRKDMLILMYTVPDYYQRYMLKRRVIRYRYPIVGALIIFIILLSASAFYFTRGIEKIPVIVLGNDNSRAVDMLSGTLPLLSHTGSIKVNSIEKLPALLVEEIAGVYMLDMQFPEVFFKQELPAVMVAKKEPPEGEEHIPVGTDSSSPVQSPPVEKDKEDESDKKKVQLSSETLVILYNTHTGETYVLTDGLTRLEGKKGGVVDAASVLEEVLEKDYGVKVERSENIHDTEYNYSYASSRKDLEEMLERHPSALAVFDIHRDAGISREESVVNIEGKDAAPVLIIVGSNARAHFPGWEDNRRFAERLELEINKKYPGLCQGVRVQEGRYNQDLHPRALLLEVGSISNSTEEAMYTARLLGEVIGPLILELKEKEE